MWLIACVVAASLAKRPRAVNMKTAAALALLPAAMAFVAPGKSHICRRESHFGLGARSEGP